MGLSAKPTSALAWEPACDPAYDPRNGSSSLNPIMSGYRKCPWAPCPYNSNRHSSLSRHLASCRYRGVHPAMHEEIQTGCMSPQSDSMAWQINLHNETGQLQEQIWPGNLGHEEDPPESGECNHSEDDLVC